MRPWAHLKGDNVVEPFRYVAFISYAHADEAVAARLHKQLETYPVPKRLGPDARQKIYPIFRDTAELTAHHSLSEKIRDAVKHSRVLIVLCSPAAKASHWVNEEIKLFRELHGEAAILCALVDGTPHTAFPPALTQGGREPLAADLTQNTVSGFRLGTTQIAASLLGVGLDELLQRDARRRTRRLQALSTAAIVFSVIMGITAFTAVDARKAAETSQAQAEGLVEYMLTDLKDKLEPVGRLDVLDSVGDKVLDYYDTVDTERQSGASLARQARARHVLGQVALDSGKMEVAETYIRAAYALTEKVLVKSPNDPEAIFAHAQSEYWVGKLYYDQRYFDMARPYWTAYDALAQQLVLLDDQNPKWVAEAGYGQNNLGSLARRTARYATALEHYKAALQSYDRVLELEPTNTAIQQSKANTLAGAEQAALITATSDESRDYLNQQIEIYETALEKYPNNKNLHYRYIQAVWALKRSDIYRKAVFKDYGDFNAIEQLSRLLKSDPDNRRWRQSLLQIIFTSASDAFARGDKLGFIGLYNDYKRVLGVTGWAEGSDDLIRAKILDIYYKCLNGENYTSLLDALNRWQFQNPPRLPDEGHMQFEVLCANIRVGQTLTAQTLAQAYLEHSWVITDALTPRHALQKIIALRHAGALNKAQALMADTDVRGFNISDVQKIYCAPTHIK